jgi:hypothetical protein
MKINFFSNSCQQYWYYTVQQGIHDVGVVNHLSIRVGQGFETRHCTYATTLVNPPTSTCIKCSSERPQVNQAHPLLWHSCRVNRQMSAVLEKLS